MFSIIGESNVRTFTKESNFKQVYHYACLSTDNKPTTDIANGSTCIVMNTGKTYIFDEDSGEWVELPSSGGGGGGGGGDYSTASVAISNNVEFSNDFDCPYIEDAHGDIPAHVASTKYLGSGATATIDVVTYHGVAVGTIGDTNLIYTVSGDITTERGEYEVLFLITGDGSITITE